MPWGHRPLPEPTDEYGWRSENRSLRLEVDRLRAALHAAQNEADHFRSQVERKKRREQ